MPEKFNAAHVIDVAFRRYNLALGAGLSKLAGKVFRIGHLGDLNELMLMGAIAGAEMAMLDVGIDVQPGSGVARPPNTGAPTSRAQKKPAQRRRSATRRAPRPWPDRRDPTHHQGRRQHATDDIVFLDRSTSESRCAASCVRASLGRVRR